MGEMASVCSPLEVGYNPVSVRLGALQARPAHQVHHGRGARPTQTLLLQHRNTYVYHAELRRRGRRASGSWQSLRRPFTTIDTCLNVSTVGFAARATTPSATRLHATRSACNNSQGGWCRRGLPGVNSIKATFSIIDTRHTFGLSMAVAARAAPASESSLRSTWFARGFIFGGCGGAGCVQSSINIIDIQHDDILCSTLRRLAS